MKEYDMTIDLETLVCTDKAQRDIQNFTNDLTGRERQLLILMTRESKICHRACENLLAKIDLPSLIARGYLAAPGHVTNMDLEKESLFNHKIMAPVHADNDADYSAPDAFLQIAAGTY